MIAPTSRRGATTDFYTPKIIARRLSFSPAASLVTPPFMLGFVIRVAGSGYYGRTPGPESGSRCYLLIRHRSGNRIT